MIKDKIVYSKKYYKISDGIKQGFDWLNANDLQAIKDGRYDIGEGIYVNVQTYNTKSEALFEAHRRYIDIQYMIDGEECCYVSDYGQMKTEIVYDEVNDIEFLNGEGDGYSLKSGEFLILFPHDAHKPAMDYKSQKKVKKAVVKVPVY